MGEYDDLIYLPHPVSRKHPPMSAMDRAAQFSPFSALTGYEAVLQEAGRLTDSRAELTEYSRDILDQKQPKQMEEKIIQLLDAWQKKQQRRNER